MGARSTSSSGFDSGPVRRRETSRPTATLRARGLLMRAEARSGAPPKLGAPVAEMIDEIASMSKGFARIRPSIARIRPARPRSHARMRASPFVRVGFVFRDHRPPGAGLGECEAREEPRGERAARDQARAPAVRQVRPRPRDHHDEPVAEPDEVPDVDEEPRQPREEAGHVHPVHHRDRAAAADGRHRPLVEVPEGQRGPGRRGRAGSTWPPPGPAASRRGSRPATACRPCRRGARRRR